MTFRGLAACGLLLVTTGVGAGCGGLRATPEGKDAGPDRTAADGSAGKDTGKDPTPTLDAPGDLSPADVPAMDAPVERPPDVPPMDAPVDMPADVLPMDAPMEMPPLCGDRKSTRLNSSHQIIS